MNVTSKVERATQTKISPSNLIWYALGSLLVGLVMMFALDHLRGLHFGAWEAHRTREASAGLARALRGPLMGWFDELALMVGLVSGGALSASAIAGRWKPLAAFFGASLAVLVAVEVTQGAGQERAVPAEVDVVPIVSLIQIGLLFAVPIILGLTAANQWRRPAN